MNKWSQYFKRSKFASFPHTNLASREKLNSSNKPSFPKENEDNRVIAPALSTQCQQRDLIQMPD